MEIFDLPHTSWDVAIVLDACRYDYFKSIYKDYLDGGDLTKVKGGSCTTHWLQSVFKHEYPEIVYVSSNPWINSITSWNGFDPSLKFKKVWDVWKWAWDEEMETVPPRYVTEAALRANEKYNHERLIIHYLQPHYPYLSVEIPEEVKMCFNDIRDGHSKSSFSGFFKFVNDRFERFLGRSTFWRVRDFFRINTNCVEEYLWRNYSPQQLREFYEDDLRTVLEEVNRLLDEIRGKVVITSDHGESLGENDEFFHPYGTKNPTVREVPLLSIES